MFKVGVNEDKQSVALQTAGACKVDVKLTPHLIEDIQSKQFSYRPAYLVEFGAAKFTLLTSFIYARITGYSRGIPLNYISRAHAI